MKINIVEISGYQKKIRQTHPASTQEKLLEHECADKAIVACLSSEPTALCSPKRPKLHTERATLDVPCLFLRVILCLKMGKKTVEKARLTGGQ